MQKLHAGFDTVAVPALFEHIAPIKLVCANFQKCPQYLNNTKQHDIVRSLFAKCEQSSRIS